MKYPSLFSLTLAFALNSGAQEIPAAVDNKPRLKLQVLDSVEVKFPDHSIFYQRVVPPVAPPPRAPAPLPVAKPLSPEETAAQEARERKKTGVLMLSATVWDRQVTHLRWFSGGRQYSAWSNIDFNYIAGQGQIETEDAVYLLMLGLGNETREAVAEPGLTDTRESKAVPALAKFPAGRSSYLLSGEAPADESLAALDALHRHFDAHRLRLIADYEKRTAANLARAQWLKEHPPVPQDTVIQFWPKKSRTYPTSGQ